MNESYPEFDFKTAPLKGVSLIEASAGTGKTYSLERLVARLIVENDTKIETMLLMTFTKAATAELSSRIRSLLIQLRESWGKQDIAEQESLDADVRELVELWQQNKGLSDKMVRDRLMVAVNSFDDASIFTIHSFCQKMLTEYVFSRGGGFGLTVGDDTDLEKQALDEFLRQVYAENRENRAFIEELQLWGKTWHEKLGQFKSQPQAVLDRISVMPCNITKTEAYVPSAEMEQCIRRFCAQVPQRIRTLKQQQKIMTYDDMLLELHQGLDHIDVVDGIRKRFKAVLVDEFQDTDSVQFSIFKRLFLDASVGNEALPNAVFFVGDPKQAIYGFRSAELEIYFKAVEFIEKSGNARYQLPRNFRSTPTIIHAVDTLFAGINEKGRTVDRNSFLHSEINYAGIVANPKKLPLMRRVVQHGIAEWHPVPAFELWTNVADTVKVGDTEKVIDVAVSRAIAEDIAQLLSRDKGTVYYGSRPLEAKDIAILVKERKHADALRKELIKHRIRTRLESRENVFQSTEAIEILTLLRAMASPDDSGVLETARATRLVGHNLKKIQQDINALSVFRQDMKEASDRIVYKGIYPEFSRLMHDRFHTVDRLLQIANGERILTNYQHILEIMQSQQQKVGDLAGIIHWLTSAINDTDAELESDESRLRIESDANVVSIVTIHASKGLEYPVVYLADALRTRMAGNRSRSVFKEYLTDDEKTLKITPVRVAASSHPQTCEREEQENIRLAYVAMTRASSRLVLPLALGIHGRSTKVDLIDMASLQCAYVRALCGSMTKYAEKDKFTNAERKWKVFLDKIAQWRQDLQSHEASMIEALKANYQAEFENLPLKVDLNAGDFYRFRDWTTLPVDETVLDDGLRIRYDVVSPEKIGAAWSRTSFTGISRGLEEVKGHPERSGFLAFPRGTEAGDSLHKLIESLVNQGIGCEDAVSFNSFVDNIDQTVERWLDKEPFYRHLQDKTGSYDADAVKMEAGVVSEEINQQAYCKAWLRQRIETLLSVTLPYDINLMEVIRSRKVVSELKFLLSAPGQDDFTIQQIADAVNLLGVSVRTDRTQALQSLKGYLTGEIDLLFRHCDGKYWVIDWKSNAIETSQSSADNPANYTQQKMEEVMDEHHYKLQALCYLVALYRYLHQMHPEVSVEQVMAMIGGAMYVFLRGVGDMTEKMSVGGVARNGVFVIPVERLKDNLLALDGLLG